MFRCTVLLFQQHSCLCLCTNTGLSVYRLCPCVRSVSYFIYVDCVSDSSDFFLIWMLHLCQNNAFLCFPHLGTCNMFATLPEDKQGLFRLSVLLQSIHRILNVADLLNEIKSISNSSAARFLLKVNSSNVSFGGPRLLRYKIHHECMFH